MHADSQTHVLGRHTVATHLRHSHEAHLVLGTSAGATISSHTWPAAVPLRPVCSLAVCRITVSFAWVYRDVVSSLVKSARLLAAAGSTDGSRVLFL